MEKYGWAGFQRRSIIFKVIHRVIKVNSRKSLENVIIKNSHNQYRKGGGMGGEEEHALEFVEKI